MLTILSSGSEAAAEDLISPGSSPAAGPARRWRFVRAELDALLARQDSEDLDPLELRAAFETIGCLGAGEFRAFAPGRTVDVRDDQGRVIASGALETGSIAGPDPGSGCRLPFTIVDVPPAAAYTIDVGGATLSYTEAQLAERGWSVELRVGSVE